VTAIDDAEWQRLCDRVARALRKLPLCRAGFEGRTRVADWAFLGLWPVGDDLEPVIRQRAADIASSILKREQIPPRREKDRPIPRDVCAEIGRRHEAGARRLDQDADWRGLLFRLRCEVKHARVTLHRTTKLEIVEQLADVYFELTGETPGLSYTGRRTQFERFGDRVFVDEPWRSTGKSACSNFSKKMGNKPAPI
jgi:hypothetical protein